MFLEDIKHDRLGNLDFDLEIRISDLQQMQNKNTNLNAKKYVLGFSFFRFYREIR